MTEAKEHYLRVHQFLESSRANGPGLRAVVWVQGCTLGCSGCFNVPTHATTGGELVRVADLVERIIALAEKIEGVTISGGEPLQQREGVAALLHQLKARTNLSVILFTGFSWSELERMGGVTSADGAASHRMSLGMLEDVDVLIAGRYDATHHLARDLRGSTNKTTYFLTGRYAEDDLQRVPLAEVVITPEGEILMSGIDPLKW
ncbi:MAG: 4Fe-4S single cluster domain-containing protein [Chloroflexota bacterium]|nr:radical SAM protein [Chloroflexota bacterium]